MFFFFFFFFWGGGGGGGGGGTVNILSQVYFIHTTRMDGKRFLVFLIGMGLTASPT